MKSGLPWNLSGVDKETREAVIEAARLSGLSVGEWLNQVLGENFEEPDLGPPAGEDEAAVLAETIQRLTARLGAMDDGARASIAGLPDRLDEIEHHISRLSNVRKDSVERNKSLKGISAMVKSLAREVDNADERARSMVEGLRAKAKGPSNSHVNDVIAELDQRIAEMRNRLTAPAPESRPLKLDEISDRLNTLLARSAAPQAKAPPQAAVIDAALQALEERIEDAKARFEAKMAAQANEPTPPPSGPPPATADQIERLEQRLAELADQMAASEAARRKPQKEAELASAIREISSHQRAIDDRAETLAMRRDQKALSAAMAALRADLGGLAEQVSAISRVGTEQHGAFFEVAQRIDSMAAEQPMDRSLLAAIRNDLATMREMVEGTARSASVGSLEARQESMAAQLHDLLRATPDRGKLDELGAEVSALRRSLEADDSPRAIQRLEMRMAELGRAIEAALSSRQAPREPDPAVGRLESQMQDIAARLEGLRDNGAHTAAIHTVEQRLDGRLNEIADRLGGLMNATPQTIASAEQRLEGRLEELAQRLAGMVDNAARPQAAAIEAAQRQLDGRLEDIVHRLGGMADTSPQQAAIEHVHERLQAITDRIDTLNASQREPSAALDAIKSEIGALRQEVAGKEIPPPPSTDHLERQIRDLARQLDTVAAAKDEGQALAELESQVARLAGELEQTKPRVAALTQVEERLDKLQSLLADTAQESIVNARAEARKAVDELSEMVAGNEIDADIVRGLMRDLESLRNATGGSDQETRTKLESVSSTVAQVVDRLSRLETETASRAKSTGTYGRDAIRPPRKEIANLARTPIRSERPTETTTPGPVAVNPPLPARQAAPAVEPPKTVIATRDSSPAGQLERRAAERRADFISAARRAAQAVADEAAAIETTPAAMAPEDTGAPKATGGGSERKPGAFARISQAIRSRKRPLLLAAAAIVLALGAMQAYGKLSVPVKNGALIAAVAKTEPVVPAAPAAPAVRDVVAEANAAPTVPQVAQPALTLPPAVPDAAIAFAEPTGLENRFTSGPAQPATDSFDGAPDDAVVAAIPPLPPAQAEPAETGNAPIVLASAEASAASPALNPAVATSGLDVRLGSPKLLNAAATGDPAAAFEIATRYADGSLVKKDLAKAAAWYSKAAEGGVAVAQYRLGSLYERGQGVTKDLTNAVNWYQRAADQGNINAMHNLAVLMSEGADAQPDHDKALQWFLAAGNYGVRDSQYNLGVIYARGLGVGQDLVESYKWFAIAASQGDTDASARRDEVAKAMSADDLAKARAAVTGWHVKPPIAEANGVAAPGGGWDGPGEAIGEADRQALVMKIQTLLAEAGYDPGPADGVAGPKTVDAVKAYQRTVGVPDTGQIDKSLMASLAQ